MGPQQTLYVPGCWLREGENEIFILDQINDSRLASVSCVDTPVLEQQRPLRLSAPAADQPTNSALDALAKNIADLQQQIVELRNQVSSLQQQLDNSQSKPRKSHKK